MGRRSREVSIHLRRRPRPFRAHTAAPTIRTLSSPPPRRFPREHPKPAPLHLAFHPLRFFLAGASTCSNTGSCWIHPAAFLRAEDISFVAAALDGVDLAACDCALQRLLLMLLCALGRCLRVCRMGASAGPVAGATCEPMARVAGFDSPAGRDGARSTRRPREVSVTTLNRPPAPYGPSTHTCSHAFSNPRRSLQRVVSRLWSAQRCARPVGSVGVRWGGGWTRYTSLRAVCERACVW